MFPTDLGIQPVELAREAEARGFDSLWFPEHSHIPVSRRTPWGGSEGAPPLPEEYWRTHDQFVALDRRGGRDRRRCASARASPSSPSATRCGWPRRSPRST